MGLRYPGLWRFQAPADGEFILSAIPSSALREFSEIVDRICTQGSRWEILEHFKSHFGISSRSSSEGWAESDLSRAMDYEAKNAPAFIEAFFSACEALTNHGKEMYAPDAAYLNKVLARHNIGYEIRPPELLAKDLTATTISVIVDSPTLAERAKSTIEGSLRRSEELLHEGRGREAVQEILWLLETVSTGLRGVETSSGKVEGKYFNKIVRDLRIKRPGTSLDQILGWVTAMHGYLSSPGGGGVRHGAELNATVALDLDQARLFCNLTRSYILYLLAEHRNLKGGS